MSHYRVIGIKEGVGYYQAQILKLDQTRIITRGWVLIPWGSLPSRPSGLYCLLQHKLVDKEFWCSNDIAEIILADIHQLLADVDIADGFLL